MFVLNRPSGSHRASRCVGQSRFSRSIRCTGRHRGSRRYRFYRWSRPLWPDRGQWGLGYCWAQRRDRIHRAARSDRGRRCHWNSGVQWGGRCNRAPGLHGANWASRGLGGHGASGREWCAGSEWTARGQRRSRGAGSCGRHRPRGDCWCHR